MKIKTIDIICLEWFDKVNGNSYFAATVTVNYGMKSEETYKIPFEYGYGDYYKYAAFDHLEKINVLKNVEHYSNGSREQIWQYCRRNNIILRTVKHENCLKRELKNL